MCRLALSGARRGGTLSAVTRLGSGGNTWRAGGVQLRPKGVGGRRPTPASRAAPLVTTAKGDGGRTGLACAPTTDAMVELQRTAGNQATLSLLAGDASPSVSTGVRDVDQLADPTLRFGARGPAVTRLQDHLVQAGAGLAVDGMFGPITSGAVRAFQRGGGLVADGIVGKRTWAALRAGNVTIATPSSTGAFTQASLADKAAARLTGLASTLRHLVPSPAGSGSGGSGGQGGKAFASFASAGSAFAPAGPGGSTFAPAGPSGSTFGPDPTAPTQADSNHAAGPDLGPLAAAAADVIGVVAQPGVAQALGNVTDQVTTVVGPLAAGSTEVPLDQLVVQLNTVTANVGQAVANQAGAATGSGSTTVGVVKQSTYKITGDTIAEVGQELDTHMSIHGEAAHVAELQPDMSKPANSTDNQAGPTMFLSTENGKVVSARVVLNLELVLPEWTKASSTKCACWKKEWDRFHTAISAHEQEHVNRAVNAFSGLHVLVKGKPEDEAWKKFDEVADAYDKAQKDFDANTDHGKKPPPGTNFNAGVPCSC